MAPHGAGASLPTAAAGAMPSGGAATTTVVVAKVAWIKRPKRQSRTTRIVVVSSARPRLIGFAVFRNMRSSNSSRSICCIGSLGRGCLIHLAIPLVTGANRKRLLRCRRRWGLAQGPGAAESQPLKLRHLQRGPGDAPIRPARRYAGAPGGTGAGRRLERPVADGTLKKGANGKKCTDGKKGTDGNNH